MKIYGCADNTLSDHLKCIIKQGDVAVVAKLPEGYSDSLQHNWTNPFADDSPGSIFQKGGGLLQLFTGTTATGFLQSFLTWEGSEPLVLTLPLRFEAESNPENEVRQPVNYLQRMSAPTFSQDVKELVNDASLEKAAEVITSKKDNLKAGVLGNKIPSSVSIKIGRNLILKGCVIESVEREDPMKYSTDGLPLIQTVTLNVRTKSTLDSQDLSQIIR